MVQNTSTEAREAAIIAEALRDAPWRKRAQLNAEFDQACREFDAMHVRPIVAPPGTHGPGDYGPDSFGGSDFP